jgi:hypothetical protein
LRGFAVPLAGPENGALGFGLAAKGEPGGGIVGLAGGMAASGPGINVTPLFGKPAFGRRESVEEFEGDVGRMPFGEDPPNKGVCGTKEPEVEDFEFAPLLDGEPAGNGEVEEPCPGICTVGKGVELEDLSAAV